MPQEEMEPLEVVSIRLYKGDRERLKELFGQTGYNVVLRRMTRKLIRTVEARAQKSLDELPSPSVDFSLEEMIQNPDQ